MAGSHYCKHLGNHAPLGNEIPGNTDAPSREQPAWVSIVVLSAEIYIDPEALAEIERHRDIEDKAVAGLVAWVIDDSAGNGEPEP